MASLKFGQVEKLPLGRIAVYKKKGFKYLNVISFKLTFELRESLELYLDFGVRQHLVLDGSSRLLVAVSFDYLETKVSCEQDDLQYLWASPWEA